MKSIPPIGSKLRVAASLATDKKGQGLHFLIGHEGFFVGLCPLPDDPKMPCPLVRFILPYDKIWHVTLCHLDFAKTGLDLMLELL